MRPRLLGFAEGARRSEQAGEQGSPAARGASRVKGVGIVMYVGSNKSEGAMLRRGHEFL